MHNCSRKIHQHNFSRKYHQHNCNRTSKLHNCKRHWHLHNCYTKSQLHSSNRHCHLQNWPQKLSLAEMVPAKDSFSCNQEIEWKAASLRQNSSSITCITQWKNLAEHCVNGIVLYIHYFNFLIFMHFTNQIALQ